jgi:peptide deformylase
MAILNIKIYGDTILREKAKEVEDKDIYVERFLNDMAETLDYYHGLGLAAPQVGVSRRIILVNAGNGLRTMINPSIVWKSGSESGLEGCLSLPGISLMIERSKEIVVRCLSRDGQQRELLIGGLEARAVQHEIDHLNGILIIDRIAKEELKSLRGELSKLESMEKQKSPRTKSLPRQKSAFGRTAVK